MPSQEEYADSILTATEIRIEIVGTGSVRHNYAGYITWNITESHGSQKLLVRKPLLWKLRPIVITCSGS